MNKTLEDRVSRLEKTNRWLMIVCAGLVVLPLLAVVGWRAQVPDEVRAKGFVLVGEDGKIRAELSADGISTILWLYRPNGKVSILLSSENERALLWLVDTAGNAAIGLEADKDGPRIRLEDVDSIDRVEMTAEKAGQLRFLDAEGKTVYSIPPDKP